MVTKPRDNKTIPISRVKALIELARKSGLHSLRVGDVAFDLGPASRIDNKGVTPETESNPMPSDDEMLYASSPYFDELQTSGK